MRCKGCDYPLWDIAARACPECGLPFKPSNYDFTINAVRFACPHCRQSYYGTDNRGQLVPSRFNCVSCARLIDQDEMLILPRDGVPEEVVTPDHMPWIERGRVGFFRGLFGTIIRSIGTPTRLASTIPVCSPDGSGGANLASAMVFGVVVLSTYLLLGFTILGLFQLIPMMLGVLGGSTASVVLGLASSLVSTIVVAFVILILWSISTHITLRCIGPASAGFNGTAAAICYSSGTNFLSAIPCVAFLTGPVGFIWWAIAAVLMLARIHRISNIRAALAVLVLPASLLIVGGLAIGAFIFWNQSLSKALMIQAPTAVVTTPQPVAVPLPPLPHGVSVRNDVPESKVLMQLGKGLFDWHATRQSWASHPMQLIVNGNLRATDLVINEQTRSRIALGTMSFEDIDLAPPNVLATLASSAVGNAIGDAGLTRMGDAILMTKGIRATGTYTDTAPDLWLAAVFPNRSARTAMFLRADGGTQTVDISSQTFDIQSAIDEQNIVRAREGVPKLPPIEQWP